MYSTAQPADHFCSKELSHSQQLLRVGYGGDQRLLRSLDQTDKHHEKLHITYLSHPARLSARYVVL